MSVTGIIIFVQLIFTAIIGLYFWNLLKNQHSNKSSVEHESNKELDKLIKLRSISLTAPLTEKTRPKKFKDIIGQDEGLKALRAALCSPNPQHVIIYGSPGIGKTAVARLVLEEARLLSYSPFTIESKFVELDATTARFDERGIADPLIGSVHDPIYQGAGAMGQAGIPQPKLGAVTKAHGGVLFIDEIGELHPIQINKLLKVLEDRKVIIESAYYSSEDSNIPKHIHDMFQNGLPADFRLVGATTRQPEEIPPAIRSRCLEIFFKPLSTESLAKIIENALVRVELEYEPDVIDIAKNYVSDGREAVNLVQIAAGVALSEQREKILVKDIEWVINNSQLTPRYEHKISSTSEVGVVNGLAVYGPNMGSLLDIEVTAKKVNLGKGKIKITGVVEEEETGNSKKILRRKSMILGSLENVLTVLNNTTDANPYDYNIHVNFPGGMQVDGPSAGISIATAIYSAIKQIPIDCKVAMTGELSIFGKVKPIGGVVAKIEAAQKAGVKKVIIPTENWQKSFDNITNIEIIRVDNLTQVLNCALLAQEDIYIKPKEIFSPTNKTVNFESMN
ncbi:MAG: ATP-dependent protease LonB [Vulcanibacillus sp.]